MTAPVHLTWMEIAKAERLRERDPLTVMRQDKPLAAQQHKISVLIGDFVANSIMLFGSHIPDDEPAAAIGQSIAAHAIQPINSQAQDCRRDEHQLAS